MPRMPNLFYSDQFYNDFTAVELKSKQDEIIHAVDMLSDFPERGSGNVSEYITETYGAHVRKLVVSPFIAVYEYDEPSDAVNVLALIHQRAAR